MEIEKLQNILNAMKGINYLEWTKLKRHIDEYFRCEADKQNNKIPLTDLDSVIREHQRFN